MGVKILVDGVERRVVGGDFGTDAFANVRVGCGEFSYGETREDTAEDEIAE
jgi:hypothetical protein